jgi:hypothetical protein
VKDSSARLAHCGTAANVKLPSIPFTRHRYQHCISPYSHPVCLHHTKNSTFFPQCIYAFHRIPIKNSDCVNSINFVAQICRCVNWQAWQVTVFLLCSGSMGLNWAICNNNFITGLCIPVASLQIRNWTWMICTDWARTAQ